MKQFSIMGPTDCKQNNIQYRHTQANRIFEFHSSGNEMFLTLYCLLNIDPNILEVSDTSPDDIARFPQVLGGIANQSSLYHH